MEPIQTQEIQPVEKNDNGVEVVTPETAPTGENNDQPDYAAALAEALEERENYKQMALAEKKKRKDLEAVQPAVEIPADIDTIVDKKVQEAVSRIATSVAAPNLDVLIGQITSNADEAKLIKFHFENSTIGDNIQERLQNARILANGKLVSKKLSEIKRVQETSATTSNAQSGTGTGNQPAPTPKDGFSAEQIAWIKKRGLDPKKVAENYKKTAL